MNGIYREIFRRHSRPLVPEPTGVRPRLRAVPGIRAVLFDVYGTLFLSSSGDVDSADPGRGARAFTEALAAAGVRASVPGEEGFRRFRHAIHRSHAAARERGVDFPEVDLVEIWSELLGELDGSGTAARPTAAADPRRLAVEYEVRANPAWPAPGMVECLDALRRRGLALGIVSNAQFFTAELFPALAGGAAEALGFDAGLVFYSYVYRCAKPGLGLFNRARTELARRGIDPRGALYVGNDVRNDVAPADRTGFRTALFAGDARSLRRREDDPEVAGVRPDVIVTGLEQLLECVGAAASSGRVG